LSEVDVKVENLVKRFGRKIAVNNVSFEVNKGDFFSILGPSGCGKTTTLRMISGFEAPTSGKIWVGGEPMEGVPPHKRKTNLVFQNLALFPMMNVFDNIAFGLLMRGEPKKKIRETVQRMLEVINLPGYENKRVNQLSGGEKQRVAIARALVLHPTVLLLDEPLGALDLKLREHMKIELKKIQAKIGTTFIYITHDQGEALVMSNKVAVMNLGEIQQIGSPDELYYEPANSFVAQFVGENNKIEGRVVEINGTDVVIEVNGKRILAKKGADIVKGENVNVFIRPEMIHVSSKKPENATNLFGGEVQSVIFEGQITRYEVKTDNGIVLNVSVPNVTKSKMHGIGMKVYLCWEKDNALVLKIQKIQAGVLE